MKSSRVMIIIIVLIMLLTTAVVIFTNNTGEEVSIAGMDKTKPPIDLNRPLVTETATFALG